MQEAAVEIFAKAAPFMEQLGTDEYLPVLQRIVETGTSSILQREIFNNRKDYSAIIKEIHPLFWK
jgi:hypothetical protein